MNSSRVIKAFITKRSAGNSGGGGNGIGITKKVVETSATSSNNDYVVVDKQSTNGRAMEVQSSDELFLRLRSEALQVVEKEPMLVHLLAKVGLLESTTLAHIRTAQNPAIVFNPSNNCNNQPAKTFEEVISRIVSHRLSSCSGGSEGNLCPQLLLQTIHNSFFSDELELGHTMAEAVRADAMAVVRRDPACDTLLEVVLFMKGFASLVIHRAARRAWKPSSIGRGGGGGEGEHNDGTNSTEITGKRFAALLLQSLASSAFGVDIHPAAQIGAGVMFDHASGIVIGETAVIGDGTTILHGVTLGGTGKENGDRHPKVGRDVLIGAGTKILGNIYIGDRVKIGAGSVVLRPIPSGATAVGAPARIIGFTPKGERPGSYVDSRLVHVEPLSGLADSLVGSTITKSTTDTSLSTSTATAEMQTTSISEEQMESSSSDIMESSDSTIGDGVDEKIAGIVKKSAAIRKNVHRDSKKDDEADDKDEDEEDDNEEDGDDEDDKITDFGTPARCHYVKFSKDDSLCPFSGKFRKCPRALSEDWISHTKLHILLIQQGCSDRECVEVFFELLHLLPPTSQARLCGCIPADVFSKNFVDVAQEKTSLDLETCQALANGDLQALGLSKKASKRFQCFFSKLGKNSARALSRISSSDLLSLSPSRRESNIVNGTERGTV